MLYEVDVLLPIRDPNTEWLRQALTSIRGQVDVKLRLVAVLHPSDAFLQEEIHGFGIPTTVVPAPEPGNIADALNAGLAECSAPFTARLDADDVATSYRLRKQVDRLHQCPDLAVAGSNCILINQDSSPMGQLTLPTDPEEVLKRMRWKSAVVHPSATFRTSEVKNLGGYRSQAAGAEDYDLWLRILQSSGIANLEEPLTYYRVHRDQISRRKPVNPGASKYVRQSRMKLAASRDESCKAAFIRHEIWELRQKVRRLRGKMK